MPDTAAAPPAFSSPSHCRADSANNIDVRDNTSPKIKYPSNVAGCEAYTGTSGAIPLNSTQWLAPNQITPLDSPSRSDTMRPRVRAKHTPNNTPANPLSRIWNETPARVARPSPRHSADAP